MAGADGRSPEDVRREIAAERNELAGAVDQLRAGLDEVTNVGERVRAKLPLVAASALGAGFVLAGGLGATMRFVARRGRDGRERARFGRYAVVDKS
jgi:Protein of unknown function (DUF3618)